MDRTISFGEHPLYTRNPTFTFDDNSVSANGIIVRDGSQPASPAIAANTNYMGPVFVYLDKPVVSLSVDVGYFNNIGSTRVVFRDEDGNVLKSSHNESYGINTFSHTSDVGIKSVSAIDDAFDVSGFSLDTVTFGPAIEYEAVPVVEAATAPIPPAVNLDGYHFDSVPEGIYSFTNTLHGDPADAWEGDPEDVIHLTAGQAGTAVFTTSLESNPNETKQFTFDFKAGTTDFLLKPGEIYEEVEAYSVDVSITYDKSAEERQIDEFINELFANIVGSVLEVKEAQYAIFEQLSKNTQSADDAVRLLGKISEKCGILGLAIDVTNKADNIIAAKRAGEDWVREAYIEVVDAVVSIAAPAVVGAGASALGTPIAGLIGGAGTSVVYTWALSDAVKDMAGQYYDELNPPQPQALALEADEPLSIMSLASFSAPNGTLLDGAETIPSPAAEQDVTAITFDAEYYIATYADAREAVASGEAANAYFHYLAVGLEKGYKPNADADPIAPETVVLTLANETPAAGYNRAIFDQPIGELSGDAGSSVELAFTDYLNEQRTDTTEFKLDAVLSALANRVARDWAINQPEAPHRAYDPQAVTSWAEQLSTGSDFRETLATLLPGHDLANVKMLAGYAQEVSPERIYQALATTAEASSLLLGLEESHIGVAEFGGMHVVLLASQAFGEPLQAEDSPAVVRLFGDDGQDIFYAGGAPGVLEGKAGPDELRGEAFDDTLIGGDGNDLLSGGGGSDDIRGGTGKDTAVFAGVQADYEVFTQGTSVSVTNSLSGDRDTLIDVEILQFSDGSYDLADRGEEAPSLPDRPDDDRSNNGETLQGTPEDDVLRGGDDEDTLAAGAGSDTLYGGAGADTAVFKDEQDRYDIEIVGGVVSVTDTQTGDENTLVNIEHLRFDDVEQAVTFDAGLDSVVTLYQQVLGRQADLDGLQFWAEQQAAGLSDGDIALRFINSEENDAFAADMSTREGINQTVDVLYEALLGREADEAGHAYWSDALASGTSLQQVANGFTSSAELQGQAPPATEWDFQV